MKNKKSAATRMKSGHNPEPIDPFYPPQIIVYDQQRFDEATKAFKALVQKEQILQLYKEKQAFEKPSVKRKRKQREAAERKFLAEVKQKQFENGSWEKKMKKKQAKRSKKITPKTETNGTNTNE